MEISKFTKAATQKGSWLHSETPWVKNGLIVSCDDHRMHLEATKLPDFDGGIERPDFKRVYSHVNFEVVAGLKLDREETQDLLGVLKLLKSRTITIGVLYRQIRFFVKKEFFELSLSYDTNVEFRDSALQVGLNSRYLYDALSNLELINRGLSFEIAVSVKDPQFDPVRITSGERTAYIMPTKL